MHERQLVPGQEFDMDYENVYYVDNGGYIDGRNAVRPGVITHREPRVRPPVPLPAAAPVTAMTPVSQPYQYPTYPAPQQSYYAPAVLPQGWAGYPMSPNYVLPHAPPNNLASILGGFGDMGTLANIVAQTFAAFLPLPAAPTPQDGTDNDSISQNTLANSSNMIRYQNALAQFARRDQQILTLGSVLKELFKRPGVAV